MSRHIRAKVDANQATLVAALRKLGATVQHLHTVGQGCPDLLVGYRGKNYLLEVKCMRSPTRREPMTGQQIRWHTRWRGQAMVVTDIEDFTDYVSCETKGASYT